MNDLLQCVVDAHGGLARWREISTVGAKITATGSVWQLKGQGDVLKDVYVEAATSEQRFTIEPFVQDGWRGIYTPDYVKIEDNDGTLIQDRWNPRQAFDGHRLETPWDNLHALYFAGYAIWNYFTLPFLATWDGFQIEEIDSWSEVPGDVWRKLQVTYPEHIHTHTRVQHLYVGAGGLIVRHDHDPDMLKGAHGAHYLTSYSDVDGLMLPFSRTVLPRREDNRSADAPPIVAMTAFEYRLS